MVGVKKAMRTESRKSRLRAARFRQMCKQYARKLRIELRLNLPREQGSSRRE